MMIKGGVRVRFNYNKCMVEPYINLIVFEVDIPLRV